VIQSLTIPRQIIDDYLLDPYLLPLRLTADIYLTFLQETLPELLEVVCLEDRREIWFQHDGAPAHFTNVVREYWQQMDWTSRPNNLAPSLPCLDTTGFLSLEPCVRNLNGDTT
jgi:hypothetical protein